MYFSFIYEYDNLKKVIMSIEPVNLLKTTKTFEGIRAIQVSKSTYGYFQMTCQEAYTKILNLCQIRITRFYDVVIVHEGQHRCHFRPLLRGAWTRRAASCEAVAPRVGGAVVVTARWELHPSMSRRRGGDGTVAARTILIDTGEENFVVTFVLFQRNVNALLIT